MTGYEPPSQLFGELFVAVQRAGVFEDSKTFCDAEPRRDPAVIVADWKRMGATDGEALRGFVLANFDLPLMHPEAPAGGSPLAEHIAGLWPQLTKPAISERPGSSALPLARRHVVPGGRFRELYYWDSYFTMLGLSRSGRQDLVEDMIATFGALLERYGRIPNGSRTYYLSRSHPPVFYLMTALSNDHSRSARETRLQWLQTEHRFWMDGAETVQPGAAHRRVVRLPDGSLLNRYWDDRAAPRDESWREDTALAEGTPDRDSAQLWRDLRAGAESGWDFSSRWLDDPADLGTIRTTSFVPIDLNSLLFGLELAIEHLARPLGQAHVAREFAERAQNRAHAIERHLWHEEAGYYADHDLTTGRVAERLTGAAAFSLFCGVAEPARGRRTGHALSQLLMPGGLSATLVRSRQQWDAPNGWAPLQWIAVEGLEAYGMDALAARIADGWVKLVDAQYRATGVLLEKYDVENCRGGSGGEYPAVTGFGWTNGVTLAFMDERQDGTGTRRVAAE